MSSKGKFWFVKVCFVYVVHIRNNGSEELSVHWSIMHIYGAGLQASAVLHGSSTGLEYDRGCIRIFTCYSSVDHLLEARNGYHNRAYTSTQPWAPTNTGATPGKIIYAVLMVKTSRESCFSSKYIPPEAWPLVGDGIIFDLHSQWPSI